MTHKSFDNIMRLWHQALIPYLDSKRLLGQHRECCALRGKGWGKKHSTVDYVFKYDLAHLYEYHSVVMVEMMKRNYLIDPKWYSRTYRGQHLPMSSLSEVGSFVAKSEMLNGKLKTCSIYPEHDDRYLRECLLNLKSKGAELINGKSIDEMLIKLDLKSVE